LDAAYLASLSTDAVPALADWYNDPALDTGIHEGIGASLACMRSIPPHRSTSWQSFNYSVWKADQVLSALDLSGYTINSDQYPPKVVTPHQVEYDCYTNMD
jgi:hypothetical protein